MYKVTMRNPKGGKAECYTTDVTDEHELQMSLELFVLGGYEIISAMKV